MSQADKASTDAEQAFRRGDLDEAKRLTQNRLRKEPTAVAPRVFLAQLLALLGEWEGACKQLSVLAKLDKESLVQVYTYGPALEAEPHRARVFAGMARPVIFGEPEPWTAMLVEALGFDAAGRHEEAAGLRAAAFEQAAGTSGRSGQNTFTWIADADVRLGPILEVILNGEYVWVPFDKIRSILIEAPQEPVDLVWAMARFTWLNGGDAAGLIPARYPGTQDLRGEGETRLLLGRLTEWRAADSGSEHPYGQRMLITDQGELPLLDIREISLGPGSASTDTASDSSEAGPGAGSGPDPGSGPAAGIVADA
jgi:type VI secretion system protein ImpE